LGERGLEWNRGGGRGSEEVEEGGGWMEKGDRESGKGKDGKGI